LVGSGADGAGARTKSKLYEIRNPSTFAGMYRITLARAS